MGTDSDSPPDAVSRFIELYEEDDDQVDTYLWISKIESLSGAGVMIGPLLVILHYVYPPFSQVMTAITGINSESITWALPLGILSVMISAPIYYLSRRRRLSYDLNSTTITYHHLGKSLRKAIDGEYKESYTILKEDVIPHMKRSNVEQFHPSRKHQIEDLESELANLSDEQRTSWLENHYLEFFDPICAEINSLRDGPNLWDLIEELESTGARESPLRRALTEIVSEVSSERIRAFVQIGVVAVSTLFVGILFGAGWAAIVPALYLARQNLAEGQGES